MATYTVKKGDNLWSIARSQLGDPYRWDEIAELNSIEATGEIYLIYPGQELTLPGSSGSTNAPVNKTSRPSIEFFGLSAGSDREMFVAWNWSKANTKEYRVVWSYYANGLWFVGEDTTIEHDSEINKRQDTYSAPENAAKVKVKVKAVSETREVNGKETEYWTSVWSTESSHDFSDNPPSKPDTPDVKMEKLVLTATLDNLDLNATHIQFQITRDNSKIFKTATVKITTGHASYSCTVTAGSEYKVRCRSVRDKIYSDWSEYSANNNTPPVASTGITVCKAQSETSAYLEWNSVKNAETYEIQYTTESRYFDNSDEVTTKSGIEFNHFEVTGLESGDEYFFRVKAVNEQGSSGWTKVKSVIIGKTPSAPTTWSSTTTAITGESLTLYWMHNSEDGSAQTSAKLELIVDGKATTHTINTASEEDDEKTMHYVINTTDYPEGTEIQWRVQTAGITKNYSEWSIQRTVDIYAPPTLELTAPETLTSFPLNITGVAGPDTQMPIGYYVTIIANDSYETVDGIGNNKIVSAGDEVYTKYLDTNEQLSLVISAGDVDLENNISYTITGRVSMDSGLVAETLSVFTVEWTDDMYEPNAEIGLDKETYTAMIRPFCEDEHGALIDGVTLAVYRREFDGTFTELATGLVNTNATFITDPHPSLDYARYRVVARTDATGAISYYDVPGYPVGEDAVIIQWDEEWSNFETQIEDEMEQPAWTGSLLRLPYNVDISDTYEPDAELVKYIGRRNPVGYRGTQIGHTSKWNMEIDREDKDTLYALRRLAIWMGDVYVREPSGSGYWADLTVSFNQTHCELTIPVTLSITRVEGGA